MNRIDLKKWLDEANIPSNAYSLFTTPKDESLCIQHAKEEFEVFYSERGIKTQLMRFSNENEACKKFIEKISDWF